MKNVFAVLTVLLSVAVTPFAQANLIENGGFEDNDIQQNSWRWFYSSAVNGWEGSTIEIWDRFQGVPVIEGFQFAELNAHGNNNQQFSIYQSFETNVGALYNLSFYYRARSNNNESFNVSLASNNTNFFSQLMDDHTRSDWSLYTGQFRAVASTTVLMFTSISPHSGTVGNFIDDVRVSGVRSTLNTVSEPSTFAVLALSVFGLLFNNFRKNTRKA